MPLSDYIEPSVDDEKRDDLFRRYISVKRRLEHVKLAALDMTGKEFMSYLRVIGGTDLARGYEPHEEDVSMLEKKLAKLAQQRS